MEYRFYKDEKITIWYRDVYLVKAETEEEAKILFIEACKNNEENDTYEIELDYSEPMFETFSPLSIKDNNGESTIEILNENEDLIWKNGNI